MKLLPVNIAFMNDVINSLYQSSQDWEIEKANIEHQLQGAHKIDTPEFAQMFVIDENGVPYFKGTQAQYDSIVGYFEQLNADVEYHLAMRKQIQMIHNRFLAKIKAATVLKE